MAGAGTHHPHGRDGPLVVLEGCQLRAVDAEQHQLQSRDQQEHLRAMAPHEVWRLYAVWQQEAGNLLYFWKLKKRKTGGFP